MVLHLPYRDWCTPCDRVRANHEFHIDTQRDNSHAEAPVIAIDYMYMTSDLRTTALLVSRRIASSLIKPNMKKMAGMSVELPLSNAGHVLSWYIPIFIRNSPLVWKFQKAFYEVISISIEHCFDGAVSWSNYSSFIVFRQITNYKITLFLKHM